mgnify:CR=1 FL=1
MKLNVGDLVREVGIPANCDTSTMPTGIVTEYLASIHVPDAVRVLWAWGEDKRWVCDVIKLNAGDS